MKKSTIHLFVFDTMTDWEYGFLIAGINNPQFHKTPGRFKVKTVALSDRPITTMGGLRVLPDLTLDKLKPTSNSKAYIAATGYIGTAFYRSKPTVKSGQLITASAMSALEFARDVFAMLDVYSDATLAAWYKLFKTGDAKYFADLMKSSDA